MNCEEVTAYFPQYIENKLSEQFEQEMDNHLDRCDKCVADLNILMSECYKVSQQDSDMILRLLRASFSLSPEREKEEIAKIIRMAAMRGKS